MFSGRIPTVAQVITEPTPTSSAPMTASRNPTRRSGLGREASTAGTDIGRSVASCPEATKDPRIPHEG